MARTVDPQRRPDILRAARKVFNAHGFGQARMADIAQEAGVAAGTVYLYFASKEALLSALTDDHFNRLADRLEASMGLGPPTAGSLAAALRAAFDFAVTEQDVVRLVLLDRGLFASRGGEAWERVQGLLRHTLSVAMAQGVLRRYDPEVLADLVVGLLAWSTESALVRGTADLASYRTTVMLLLESALVKENE